MAKCPYLETADTGSLHLAKYWYSPGKTSDYFHACANGNNSIDARADVPKNAVGYQYARTGDGYAGIALMDSTPFSIIPHAIYREYAEGTLLSPLQKDSVYQVKFFVSRGDNPEVANRATDRIGAYFHQQFIVPTVYITGVPFIINAQPQVENLRGRFLYDTAGWTAVCEYFRAKGGEAYLTIGNFYDDAQTPYVQTAPTISHNASYYYLDDVSVEKVPQHRSPYNFTDHAVICATDALSSYQVPDALSQVLWSTGDSAHQVDIPGAGQLWVRAMLDGCLFTDTFHIAYVPPPQFSFGADSAEVCVTALPLAFQTDDCCARVLWSTGDTTPATTISQPGWAWIAEINVCGTLRDSLYITVALPPALDLGQDTALCDTLPFLRTLSASAGMDAYRWSTGDTTAAVQVGQPGRYWVEAQNACGLFRDSIWIKDLRQDWLRLPPDTTLCLRQPLSLQAQPSFDAYTWSTGEHIAQIEVQAYGRYYLTVTNACGMQRDSVNIHESNRPNVVLPLAISLHLGDSMQLLPLVSHDKPVDYVWEFSPYLGCTDCAEPFARPFVASVFRLIVTDALGCTATAVIPVSVLETQRIYVPNIFSPNDDGQNDRLVVYFGGEVEAVLSAVVFDRWGETMVEQKDIPAGQSLEVWDGQYRNKPAGPGIYVIVLKLRMVDGRIVHRATDVALVR